MMRIDLTCPVEAWKVTLPTEETPACDVTLFNLSSLQVVSVEITLLLSSGDGEETAKVTHRGRGLSGAPGKTFHMTVPVEGHISPERYEATVEKVWFDNSSVWRHEKENTISYEPNNLHRSSQLTALRAIAGEGASGYPVQQKNLWLCVCGRPNPDEMPFCARCHRGKGEVFARFSREAVDAAIAEREQELTERGREALQHTGSRFADEKDFVRRKGKHGWVLKAAAGVAAAAVLGYAGVTWGLPHVNYQLARMDYADGQYPEAAERFAALGAYKDAPALAREAILREEYALLSDLETLDDDQYLIHTEALDGIGETFAEMDGMTVASTALRADCDWKYAEYLFGEERYEEAEPLYQAQGMTGRLQEIAYIRANAALTDGDWEGARAAFDTLDDYQDSASLRLDTWYIPAKQAMEAGDTDTALSLFAQIPGHKDADMLVKQIHYEEGVALRAEGRINEAAEAFDLARGYEDAEAQAAECFYVPASVAWEIMEYEQAAALFARIPGYRDADEKWRASLIEAAKIAIKQINYPKALTFLSQLPAEDEEAASLTKDCTYYPAVNATVRGDYAEAAALFAQISGHRDADALLLRCKYDWAGALAEAGEYTQAEALYTELGEYEDAAARLTATRYARAQAAIAAGDALGIDQAIALLSALGEYENAPALLRDATFAKANILLEKGEHVAARTLYLSLGEYEGAAEKLAACDYAAALALAAEGKLEDAMTAFEALGEYGDAEAQMQKLRYDAALALSVTDPTQAIALLEALGDYEDAADHARELRYQQAESLLLTDRDAALAAFRALGDYADAKARADEMSYADAEALLATDRSAAILIFEAIAGYRDAADRAAQMRYEDAAALAASGDWEGAAAEYDRIPDYQDAATRANQLRYDAAIAYADAGEWDKAEATFAAMSGEMDADETVNALRYEAAEKLLEQGKNETAAAAFEAIGGYSDAIDRAREIRYQAAKTLAETDWEGAAAAFDALADYSDAADQANALRYNAAAQTAVSGDWQKAADMFKALGNYSDSASRVYQVQYDAAAKMVARQEWDDAVALYTALGDYADCRDRISITRYAQAQAVEEAGDYLAAAKLYKGISSYRDSASKASQMYDLYYSGPAGAMRAASKNKNYQEVLQIMSWLDMTDAPAKYKDLTTLYQEALYQEGSRLFEAGYPYEAYPYFMKLPADYRGLKAKMQRAVYLILGTWEDKEGNRYIFRGEGVCNLNGETLCFNLQGSAMSTGKTAGALTETHRVTGVNRKNAWLYDKRSGKEVAIYLTRVAE